VEPAQRDAHNQFVLLDWGHNSNAALIFAGAAAAVAGSALVWSCAHWQGVGSVLFQHIEC
jgi:hypothetical protein